MAARRLKASPASSWLSPKDVRARTDRKEPGLLCCCPQRPNRAQHDHAGAGRVPLAAMQMSRSKGSRDGSNLITDIAASSWCGGWRPAGQAPPAGLAGCPAGRVRLADGRQAGHIAWWPSLALGGGSASGAPSSPAGCGRPILSAGYVTWICGMREGRAACVAGGRGRPAITGPGGSWQPDVPVPALPQVVLLEPHLHGVHLRAGDHHGGLARGQHMIGEDHHAVITGVHHAHRGHLAEVLVPGGRLSLDRRDDVAGGHLGHRLGGEPGLGDPDRHRGLPGAGTCAAMPAA